MQKNDWTTTAEEKIALAANRREDGNMLFSEKQYAKARRMYQRALRVLENFVVDHDDDEDEGDNATQECQSSEAVQQLKLVCHLNMSACCLRLQDYAGAMQSATEALHINPSNVKALFRRGQAYAKLDEYEKAHTDLTQALALADDASKRSVCGANIIVIDDDVVVVV